MDRMYVDLKELYNGILDVLEGKANSLSELYEKLHELEIEYDLE